MNGQLTANAIFMVLNARAQRFAELPPGITYTLSEITDLTGSLEDELIRMAKVDLDKVAREVVAEIGIGRKVIAIKTTRDRTGCGLREAKLAVEVAIAEQAVRDAWDRANEALTKLEQANRHVPYSKRALIDGSRFRNAVGVTEINDEPPF
jgi:ribosomal protein L7/L12